MEKFALCTFIYLFETGSHIAGAGCEQRIFKNDLILLTLPFNTGTTGMRHHGWLSGHLSCFLCFLLFCCRDGVCCMGGDCAPVCALRRLGEDAMRPPYSVTLRRMPLRQNLSLNPERSGDQQAPVTLSPSPFRRTGATGAMATPGVLCGH